MKTLILTFLLLFSCGLLRAQCPTGDLIPYEQAEIDDFASSWPDCDTIRGDLIIGFSLLHNLLGLEQIRHIEGSLFIYENPLLETLHGLENLTTVGQYVSITDNEGLVSLSGMNNLTTIGKSLGIARNSLLENLEGLNQLSYIGEDLSIRENPVLATLDGLEELDTIRGELFIYADSLLSSIQALADLDYLYELEFFGNDHITSLAGLEQAFIDSIIYIVGNGALTSLDGLGSLEDFSGSMIIAHMMIDDFSVLSGLDSLDYLHLQACDSLKSVQVLNHLVWVEKGISLRDNDNLVSLQGMSNLQYTGQMVISDNNRLDNLAGLSGLKVVERTLIIEYNGLQSLEGLDSLVSVGKNLYIVGEDNLFDLSGLEQLGTVGEELWISYNAQLQHLNGLEGLHSIGGLIIPDNLSLSSLNGLENLQHIEDRIYIKDNISLMDLTALNHSVTSVNHGVFITNNPLLNACAVQTVCEFLGAFGPTTISNNGNGCENPTEVIEACVTSTAPGLNALLTCVLAPNPVLNSLHIRIDQDAEVTLRLRHPNGSTLMEDSFIRDHQLDLSGLSAGVYFIEIRIDDEVIVKKVMKAKI